MSGIIKLWNATLTSSWLSNIIQPKLDLYNSFISSRHLGSERLQMQTVVYSDIYNLYHLVSRHICTYSLHNMQCSGQVLLRSEEISNFRYTIKQFTTTLNHACSKKLYVWMTSTVYIACKILLLLVKVHFADLETTLSQLSDLYIKYAGCIHIWLKLYIETHYSQSLFHSLGTAASLFHILRSCRVRLRASIHSTRSSFTSAEIICLQRKMKTHW